jgi:IK cytokine
MSLLEQNRARAAPSTEDDDILEQAFVEAVSTSPTIESRKRTREDIIRDLKTKRQNGSRDQAGEESVPVEESVEDDRLALEAAKKAGKFKPIGFKPIGQKEEKAKKRKGKGEKEGEKKKKRKVESLPQQSEAKGDATEEYLLAHAELKIAESSSQATEKRPGPEPALLDEDFDIFAGTGDYEGFPDGEESDEFDESKAARATPAAEDSRSPVSPSHVVKGWFDEPCPDVQQSPGAASSRPPALKSPPRNMEMQPVEEEEGELRLKPLESSALPSIREFLAIDEAAEKAEKRRARKEKKKKKKAGDDDDD